MSNYTVEVKLQAVEHYLTGNQSNKTIAESIGEDKIASDYLGEII